MASSPSPNLPVPPGNLDAKLGVTQPVYSYADAIREVVRVTSRVSSQDDGALDIIYVDLIRPAETAEGIRVPTIVLPSGYFGSRGRTRQAEAKAPPGTPLKFFPHFYDNYFVPRGYAVALVDVAGTRGSTGCPDILGPAEIDGTGAVVEWLAGNGEAVDLEDSPVVADWSTGKVGLIGKSWDGTIPNRMATRDIKGLTTIVPIAAVSELHGDFFANGARYGGTPMRYSDPHRVTADELVTKVRDLFAAEQDNPEPETDFWEGRSALRYAHNVTASVFIAHGRNDYNVTPNQYARWWKALGEHNVPRKLWLGLAAHEEPFDFRREEWVNTLHRWFDHWLYGVENGIMDEPAVDIEHAPGQWSTHKAWPDRDAEPVTFMPTTTGEPGNQATGRLCPDYSAVDAAPTMPYTAGYLGIDEMTRDPHSSLGYRVVLITDPLQKPVRVSGWPQIDLDLTIEDEDATISVLLVDYGRAERLQWQVGGGIRELETKTTIGDGTEVDRGTYRDTVPRTHVTDFEVITRGWANAKYMLGDALQSTVGPNRLSFELEPDDHIFDAGHRIGVVISGADADMLWEVSQDARLAVQPTTTVTLPVVGGRSALRTAGL